MNEQKWSELAKDIDGVLTDKEMEEGHCLARTYNTKKELADNEILLKDIQGNNLSYEERNELNKQ